MTETSKSGKTRGPSAKVDCMALFSNSEGSRSVDMKAENKFESFSHFSHLYFVTTGFIFIYCWVSIFWK